jgi:uncharacterized protein YqgC (DUF456 family)
MPIGDRLMWIDGASADSSNGHRRLSLQEGGSVALMAVLWVLSLILVGVGLAGVLVPGLPGTPLVFAGLLLAAWIDGFQNVGAATVVILAVITALAFGVDVVASSLGARRAGASREAVIGAALGTLIGIFFGLPGILLGPFIGAVLGEFIARRDLDQAGRAGVGTWVGFLFGVGVKLVLAFAMVGIFVIAYIV